LTGYSQTDRFSREVVSDQLIRWCCIDRLSWHGLLDKFLWLFRGGV
jgi:hypothetical protein